MRYVPIHPPITPVNPLTKEPLPGAQGLTFFEFIINVVLQDIGGSREKWNAANAIADAFVKAKDTNAEYCELREEDWTLLSKACEAPSKISGGGARQFAPYLNAVCGAQQVKPVTTIINSVGEEIGKAKELRA